MAIRRPDERRMSLFSSGKVGGLIRPSLPRVVSSRFLSHLCVDEERELAVNA